ncbi:MAG: pyridoxamine 5'-phosphate oxidase family protein [Neptuniibacter sp.]
MAKLYSEITDTILRFIEEQKIFFVGTAVADGRVNISPKGMDTFRVVNNKQVMWMNLTGSGNETSAHVQVNPRMTIMFTAFEGSPMILRLYGQAEVIHKNDSEWRDVAPLFPDHLGARQIFRLSVDLVQTSCGFGVPLFAHEGERDQLEGWAKRKGDKGIEDYWELKNQASIDGIPTHIMSKNT